MSDNDMNESKLLDNILDKALGKGFEQAEASFSTEESMSVDILNGEVSSFENSSSKEYSFRGKKNGQMGSCFAPDGDDENAEYMVKTALENCEVLDDEDEDFLYCDPNNSDLLCDQTSGNYGKNTYDKFSEVGLKLEKDILALSPDIKAVDYLTVSCGNNTSIVRNSLGLSKIRKGDEITIIAECRAVRDEEVKTGGHLWYGRDIDKFDEKEFLDVLGKKVLGKLGAHSIPSGEYKVIFDREAFVSLLRAFMNNFSSYAMQHGFSLLAGREGEKIASEVLTISEEPEYESAFDVFPFDGEGVKTYSKNLIENGVFIKALYNLKTAHKAGIESTGNGFKSGGSVGVGLTNVVIKPGEKDFDGLVGDMGDGLYITDLGGLHAGVNSVSGDFSLICEGYLIKGGKIDHPVEQITVSDNFYEVLKKVIATGSDIKPVPGGIGEYFSPSVVISSMNIAGSSGKEE